VLLLGRGEPFEAIINLVYAVVIGLFGVGLHTYTSLTETISTLRCQDLNERKLRPLFSKLKIWKKLPGSRGTPYFCTAGTLAIFRAFMGDTDVAVRELREILDEQTKYSKRWSTAIRKLWPIKTLISMR